MHIVQLLTITITFFLLLSNADDGWFLAKQTADSFQPPPREDTHLFQINNTHALLYGGWFEAIAYNRGNSTFFNDVFLLDETNPSLIKWSLIPNLGSVAPVPRSLDCAAYSPVSNAIYIYGGVNYTADFSSLTFWDDAWVFYLGNQTWRRIDEHAPAGIRAGHGCAYKNDYVYVTHGSHGTDLTYLNDTWTWYLPTNQWTKLTTSSVRPGGRFQFEFDRIPGTDNFLLANGQFSTSPTTSIYLTDVWVLYSTTGLWQQLDVSNIPQPVIDAAGYALTSDKYLLMAGGDSGLANLTVADTCKPPLDCEVRANPVDTNFFLRLRIDHGEADWDDAEFDHSFPPVRKARILIMEPYLYLVGGTGWDGQHGVGVIYNPYTWQIKLKDKFFD